MISFFVGVSICREENHLLPELAPDVAEPLDTVEAHRLEAAVTKHLGHLWVLVLSLVNTEFT